MNEDRIENSLSWSDVAAGYHRAIKIFEDFIRPVCEKNGHPSLGITHIIFLINIGDGPRKIVDLIKAERYPGSNVSYALSTLESASLINRYSDSVDSRVKVVELTESGLNLLHDIRVKTAGRDNQIEAALQSIGIFENAVSPI